MERKEKKIEEDKEPRYMKLHIHIPEILYR